MKDGKIRFSDCVRICSVSPLVSGLAARIFGSWIEMARRVGHACPLAAAEQILTHIWKSWKGEASLMV